MPQALTHLSLFSGIGGIDLAAEWAGFRTVGQCEWADYPTRVLEKHWPDVPRWRDVRTLTGESFHERTGLRTVDLLSRGFPCQPLSVAGKQKGRADDRYLWPEMLRVIRELAPGWVLAENVPGILHIAADEVCADLERAGYEVGIFDFEAAAVGAPHRRERIAFVAHRNEIRRDMREPAREGIQRAGQTRDETDTGDRTVADAAGTNVEGRRGQATPKPNTRSGERQPSAANRAPLCDAERGRLPGNDGRREVPEPAGRCADASDAEGQWGDRPVRTWGGRPGFTDGGLWAVEPRVGRVAYGVPARVDRLAGLGNAVVPQWAYPILAAIHEIETEVRA
ncbi:MAG: DNA cytosine methyltransferase [Candidatus Limiplasma sp.]|nr:DNA cytosine methyltransferase [Candidatus Limiplasma sp.]